MGITAAVVRAAATIDSAPYTQDFTTADLGGLTPKAALFFITRATSDGAAAAHANFGIGAATGAANEWAIATTDEDGQGTTDTGARVRDDACILIVDPGNEGSVDGQAEFSSFIANGVRVNWTNAPAAAYLVTAVLFAGTDLSAHADNAALGNSTNNAVNITDPGFEPDLVIAACQGRSGINSSGTNALLSVGAVHNGVGVTQRCFGSASRHNQAAAAVAMRYTESYGVMETVGSSGALDWGGEFSAFDADGFTVTTRNAGANNTALCYLALNFNNAADAWVGTVDTPTGGGNDSIAAPGFTPQFVMQGMTLTEAIDTAYTNELAGSHGLSAFDDDDEYANSVSSDDGEGTTDTQSLSDDTAVQLPDDDGTAGLTASFVSLDANGWTLNWSAVEANAKKFWSLAIEEGVTTTETSVAFQAALRAIVTTIAAFTSALRMEVTNTPVYQAALRAANSVTVATAATLRASVTATIAFLAVLIATITNTATFQAVLKAVVDVTAAGKAALRTAVDASAQVQARLAAITTASVQYASVLRASVEVTSAYQTVLRGVVSVTVVGKAALRASVDTATALKGILRASVDNAARHTVTLRAEVTNTAAYKVALRAQTTVTAAFQAGLRATVDAAASARAALRASVDVTAGYMAVFRDSVTNTAVFQSMLAAITIVTATFQAVLRAVIDSTARHASALRAQIEATVTVQAFLATSVTVTTALKVVLRAVIDVTVSVTLALRGTVENTAAFQAFLAVITTVATTFKNVLRQLVEATVPGRAVLRGVVSVTVAVGAFISTIVSVLVAIKAFLRETIDATAAVQARLNVIAADMIVPPRNFAPLTHDRSMTVLVEPRGLTAVVKQR